MRQTIQIDFDLWGALRQWAKARDFGTREEVDQATTLLLIEYGRSADAIEAKLLAAHGTKAEQADGI